MKSLIRNILVLLGYFFVVACPMGPAGAPASVPTGADASRALIGQPLSASGGDASGVGGTTGGGDSGDLGTGGTTGSGASGTVSDAPIVISGNTMGVMPGPNCGYPAGTKVFIDEVQSAVTGDKDELGRDLIQVKGAAYTQSADGTHHGFQGEFL